MKLKLFILLTSPFICMACYAQKTAILDLKKLNNFSEVNKFWKDSLLTLYQEVNYDEPVVKDEEYCYYLVIQFHQIIPSTKEMIYDLAKDSALISVYCKRNSVWDWSSIKKINTGYLRILAENKKRIQVRLSFNMINEKDKDLFIYSGIRNFTKGRKPAYFDRIVFH